MSSAKIEETTEDNVVQSTQKAGGDAATNVTSSVKDGVDAMTKDGADRKSVV